MVGETLRWSSPPPRMVVLHVHMTEQIGVHKPHEEGAVVAITRVVQ